MERCGSIFAGDLPAWPGWRESAAAARGSAGGLGRRARRLGATLLVAGAVAACSGGGGGGGAAGGGPSLDHSSPSFFETREYAANRGLEELRASSAYAGGATGKGVTVAVIDTGIDTVHPEFDGALAAASTHIGSGLVQDVDGHGTAIAGVIGARKNGKLSHGVAYESRILAIRADESCEGGCVFRESGVARATDYAVDHGAEVINYSLGGGTSIGPRLADALARATAEGAILVFAAGNEGAADPTFPAGFATRPEAGGQAIAVGALGADGAIAGFSNRAGVAQDVFVVAPGVEVFAPALGGGGRLVSGTSFATAHVSGAAALVLSASPFLGPAEVVAILLQSATDLGEPGPDPIYGQGLVDVGAALGPLGELALPLGGRVEGERAPLEASALAFGPAFGPGPALGEAILLDAYGRPYAFDLQGRVAAGTPDLDLLRFMGPAEPVRSGRAEFGPGLGLRLGFAEAPAADREIDAAGESERRFLMTAELGEATALSVMSGWSLGGQFGLAAQRGLADGLITAGALSSPYLLLADGGAALALAQELGAGLRVKVGLAQAAPGSEFGPPAGERHALVAELGRDWDNGASLGVQIGRLEEGSTLLDSRGRGAFALDGGAGTSFLGLAARLPVAADLELFGQASYGLTSAGPGRATLVEGVSDLHSMALALGLGHDSLFAADDRLTFTLAQPLRVVAGFASLDRPVGRTFDGEIVRERDQIALVPDGREIDLELAYRLPLGQERDLALNWLTRIEPGHDPERSPAHALAVRYRSRF